ncbi:MAG: hypothetical protein U0987_07340 [Afipia sp.]|nr:hypothetical protein [Afipia sp.]
MATSDKDRQVEPVGKIHWAVIALVILMTLGILALAVRVEKAGPPKPDRNRIFDNLKSID